MSAERPPWLSSYTGGMRLGFRSALMWLLLLALPLQGFAAATLLNCGPNHHRVVVAAAGVADAAAAHVHAQGSHDMQADMHAELHADQDADQGADQGAGTPAEKVAASKCSACAACCLGAALPTATSLVPAIAPAISPTVFVATPHVDVMSDRLDRPPRLHAV